jgi:hypothetical protein
MTRRIPAGEPGLSQGGRKRYDDKSLPPVADDQQAFFNPPRARGHVDRRDGTLVTDPATSRAAAESLSWGTINRLQRVALNTFRLARRPLSDEQLISEIHRQFPSVRATDSSWRTRRRELQRGGLVELVDEAGVTASGRACRRFRAVMRDAG